MAVALGDLGGTAIDLGDAAAALEHRGIRAEPHGAAEVAGLRALLELVTAQPFRHQTDQRLRRRTEFGGVGVLDADEVSRGLDDRHLHAKTDAEIRHVTLARELRRADFSLRTALAEAARHQNAVDML